MLSLESNAIQASNKKPYQAPSLIQLGVKGTETKTVLDTTEHGLTSGS